MGQDDRDVLAEFVASDNRIKEDGILKVAELKRCMDPCDEKSDSGIDRLNRMWDLEEPATQAIK